MPTNLLTVQQAAEFWGVTEDEVYRRMKAGLIKAERLGSIWTLKAADVRRYKSRPPGRPPAKKSSKRKSK